MRNVAIRFLISLICSTVYFGGTLRGLHFEPNLGAGSSLKLIKLWLSRFCQAIERFPIQSKK